jgi:heme exporter protein A
MPDCLSGEDLSCIRGERLVFAKLAFRLDAGGALVLRGPNGSGKSSLLRLIAGLARPTTGAIAWNGATIARDRAAHRARVAYAGHADAIKPALTVEENFRFWTGLRGASSDAAAVLARLGLDRHAAIHGRFLSSGEKRRLALATLAASGAPVWLLDEPTVGLDAASLSALEALLAEHCRSGGMVVLSTHVDLALDAAATLDLGAFAVARPAPLEGMLA